jgi:demethylmenaquinone methyltransferase / 2-methoxy-6-polyprenyl-1,4-benzoquinol methylase
LMMNRMDLSIKCLPYKKVELVTPYTDTDSKKIQVRAMFNSIARSYDFLNHFLSFGIDIAWRKRVIKMSLKEHPKIILDLATGTADLAIMLAKAHNTKVIGADLSEQMLAVGKEKVLKQKLVHFIDLRIEDAENLSFSDNTFDLVTVAFGVRNFENLEKGLAEIYRVLKPDGIVLILEFSKPKRFPVKQLYHFYSYSLLPFFGRFVSKSKRAYSYLPESISEFIYGENFTNVMTSVGFGECQIKKLSFGISTIYSGRKQ